MLLGYLQKIIDKKVDLPVLFRQYIWKTDNFTIYRLIGIVSVILFILIELPISELLKKVGLPVIFRLYMSKTDNFTIYRLIGILSVNFFILIELPIFDLLKKVGLLVISLLYMVKTDKNHHLPVFRS